jgi:tripartite-type tricarboxylate transporter receptor subunit TctC
MIGGEVEMAFSSPPSLMGFVKSGQAKLIAINAGKRSPLTPNVPALAEKIPGFDFAFNVVLLAKPGTPPEALQKLNAEVAKAVRQPELIEQFQKAGVDSVGGTQQEAAAALASESRRITAAARHAGLKRE